MCIFCHNYKNAMNCYPFESSTEESWHILEPHRVKMKGFKRNSRKTIHMSSQLDARIVILMLFCLVLTGYNMYPEQEGRGDTPPSENSYFLIWTGDSLSITTNIDRTTAPKIPARIAPLFFQKFDINQADVDLLQIIPGIGPQLAKRIITERHTNGGFTNSDQLLNIAGIGQKRRELLMEWIKFE